MYFLIFSQPSDFSYIMRMGEIIMKIEVKEKFLKQAFAKYNVKIEPSTISKLALIAETVTFPRGEMVLGINQPQSAVYLITQGVAKS